MPRIRNNPHPARGRKPVLSRNRGNGSRNNPHPARGRKPLPAEFTVQEDRRNNPHPARGRKLSCRPYPHFLSGNDPHPARGRKPRAIRISSISEETTHTPQGDGNLHPVGKPINHSKQPTPRKGTETASRPRTAPYSLKQPTPRKGTETLLKPQWPTK